MSLHTKEFHLMLVIFYEKYYFVKHECFLYRYISNPTGEPISSTFLNNGNYEIEVMGKKYDTKMSLKSPLDPVDKRVLGIYDEPLPVRL